MINLISVDTLHGILTFDQQVTGLAGPETSVVVDNGTGGTSPVMDVPQSASTTMNFVSWNNAPPGVTGEPYAFDGTPAYIAPVAPYTGFNPSTGTTI